ncbi:hypothetical protein B0O80DRAFT_178961 [Mortierella sp. GBAus27b]|nr:hypothetical protein B0O80DRAFT_178961 [Mortierella sp. GBAus27b]
MDGLVEQKKNESTDLLSSQRAMDIEIDTTHNPSKATEQTNQKQQPPFPSVFALFPISRSCSLSHLALHIPLRHCLLRSLQPPPSDCCVRTRWCNNAARPFDFFIQTKVCGQLHNNGQGQCCRCCCKAHAHCARRTPKLAWGWRGRRGFILFLRVQVREQVGVWCCVCGDTDLRCLVASRCLSLFFIPLNTSKLCLPSFSRSFLDSPCIIHAGPYRFN